MHIVIVLPMIELVYCGAVVLQYSIYSLSKGTYRGDSSRANKGWIIAVSICTIIYIRRQQDARNVVSIMFRLHVSNGNKSMSDIVLLDSDKPQQTWPNLY